MVSSYADRSRDYHEQVGMQEAVRRAFNNYAVFSGRSNRGEYWWFALANILISLGLQILDRAFFGTEVAVLNGLWSLVVLIPSLALGARRLHDIDKSGWWQLIWLIPLVGWIVLIVWFAQKGENRPNRFG